MIKKILFFAVTFFFVASLFAQEDELRNKESLSKVGEGLPNGWTTGGTFGLNLDQLLIINPRAGAGDNKFGFGGNVGFFGTYKKDRFVWDNTFNLQETFQRLGRSQGGLIGGNPFQKTIDMLEFFTKPGYAITADEKWYAAIEAGLQSQLFKTFAGAYLKDATNLNADPISAFFSPAAITITPGVEWRPNANFSLLVSPIAVRMLIVANEDIADDYVLDADGNFVGSVHGNPIAGFDPLTGAAIGVESMDFQLGAAAKAKYQNTFLNDRISFATTAYTYYNYLGGAGDKNLPIFEWTTNTGFNIYKGLSLNLLTGLYYDYNKLVSKDYDADTGNFRVQGAHGAMFTEQILITYSKIFGAEKKE